MYSRHAENKVGGMSALVLWNGVQRRSNYSSSTPFHPTLNKTHTKEVVFVRAAMIFLENDANDGSSETREGTTCIRKQTL